MKILRVSALLVPVLVLAFVVTARAGSVKPPPAGPYKLSQNGTGFTLKKSGRKYLVSDLHSKTGLYAGCPEKPTVIRVLGKHPIKTFTRGGYTTWGVGKNVGGDVAAMPARVKVGPKVYNGTFYLVWDYSDFHRILGGSIGFGECDVQNLYGSHK